MGRDWYLFGRAPECTHENTVTVSTSGITRMVCQRCRHVEIRGFDFVVGELDRSLFARGSESGRHSSPLLNQTADE
jgi:hypothetical protein